MIVDCVVAAFHLANNYASQVIYERQPRHFQLAIRCDEELYCPVQATTAGSSVIPYIHKSHTYEKGGPPKKPSL